jgi:RNA polymerase sigma-70 factor (ECF subfamily)
MELELSDGSASANLALGAERAARAGASCAGAQRLIEELYDLHSAGLHRYLLLTGCQAADADELLQEAFLRLFRFLRSGRRVERPKPWLFRVLHNLRADQARREAGYTELPDGDVGVSTEADPETAALARERNEALRRAMGSLTERQLRYLLLRAEGLTLREIAEIQGVALQSVAETCARAMKRLGELTRD